MTLDIHVRYKHIFGALTNTERRHPLRFLCNELYFIAIDAEWYEFAGNNIVLSYQIATASRSKSINIIKYVSSGQRLTFSELIDLGIRSVNDGNIPENHRNIRVGVVVVSHNFAAEWSVLADRDDPSITKRLSLVRKSPITDGHAIKMVLNGRFPIRVLVYDTMLLAPATHRSLAKLSQLLGNENFQKIPIKQSEIEHMDRLLREDPARFEAYALRDTEVCLKLFFLLQDALNRLAYGEGEFRKLFRTLASAGVESFIKQPENNWFPFYLQCLGLAQPSKVPSLRQITMQIAPRFADPYRLIRRSYHGGRNESFFVGDTEDFEHTRDKVWVDIDFSGCYPTAMALCPKIDLSGKIRQTALTYRIDEKTATVMAQSGVPVDLIAEAQTALATSPREFERFLRERVPSRAVSRKIREGALVFNNSLIKRWQRLTRKKNRWNPDSYVIPGFARVRFSFPEGTQFPCLPVKHYRYGLIYPLKGETVATASEILLALDSGAKIQALTSVELPIATMKTSETSEGMAVEASSGRHQPHLFFLNHLREILRQRNIYKNQKGDQSAQVYEKLLKEFANSFYGKFAQAINPRNVYRPSTGEMVSLGPSTLTEPSVAALCTGLARAALSATLIAVEEYNRGKSPREQITVISATTDGLLIGLPYDPGYSVISDYYLRAPQEGGRLGTPVLRSESKLPSEDARKAKASMEIGNLLSRFGHGELLEYIKGYLPIRQMMYSRMALTGTPDLFEVKHLVDKVISIKTRGQIGLLRTGHAPLLARFGHKPPLSERIKNPEIYKRVMETGGTLRNTIDSRWLQNQLRRVRKGYDTINTYTFITLTSFRKMSESEGRVDLIKNTRQQRVNTDFDWKRKIVDPKSPETEPFADLGEMLLHRGQMEAIRRTGYIASPAKVLHRVTLKQRTTRQRDGDAVTLVRHFLRGIVHEQLPTPTAARNYRKWSDMINQVWRGWDDSSKKIWSVDDFKNAKRSSWEAGVLLPTYPLTQLLERLCREFGMNLEVTAGRLFVSSEHREESVGQIKEVVRAVLLAPQMGIEPFKTLFQEGRLPDSVGLLAVFRPVLTETMLAECARSHFHPGNRRAQERGQLIRLFRRLGLTVKQAENCSRILAQPEPKRTSPRRNPAEKRCLENFVMALGLQDINPVALKSAQIIDRLSRFGLTKNLFYSLRKNRFIGRSLNNTPENRRQIERMAKALRLDAVPFLDALLDH